MTQPSIGQLLAGKLDVRVSPRPDPIPVDLRRSWRIATLVLILAASRSKRAGREKLLLLNYSLRNPDTQEALIAVLTGTQSPFFLEVRVDPALARALDFAIGLGLVRKAGAATVELTETGISLAEALNGDESILSTEKGFLARVRNLATEAKVREVLQWR
jgi:hypothetical protein